MAFVVKLDNYFLIQYIFIVLYNVGDSQLILHFLRRQNGNKMFIYLQTIIFGEIYKYQGTLVGF